MSTLLVILTEALSQIVEKGEFTPRYYNPGEIFDEVHILLLNDDHPNVESIQPTVGEARLHIHNLPRESGLVYKSLGYRPWLLRKWAKAGVELAKGVEPDLVRCYGNGLNAFVGSEIKRTLGIPMIISLHGNPDVDYYRGRRGTTFKLRMLGRATESIETLAIKAADHVLPVYDPIVPYLEKHGISSYTVVHNAVGYGAERKTDYSLDPSNVRALCVGRQQYLEKDPSPIIEAIAAKPGVRLHLIGDGDLHDSLEELAVKLGVTDRITFDRSLPNESILKRMHETDVYVYSSVNFEVSKTSIEAALVGLPIILNDRNGNPAPELEGGHFLLVDGSKESYLQAIEDLISDDSVRAAQGNRAYAHASENWSPHVMEARVAEIHSRYSKEHE